MGVKSFRKKYPILSLLILVAIFFMLGYLGLVTYVLRPVNINNGRMNSYDKDWSEIKSEIQKVQVGNSKEKVKNILGEYDILNTNFDSTFIWSYQQYGVVAPHWVYDIHFRNDTVYKIESYDW